MMLPQAPALLPEHAAPYWRYFWASGVSHGVSPLLIAAICDIETDFGESPLLDVPGPAGRGDGGHGHGLMQIDDRWHADWLAYEDALGVPLWTMPGFNVEYAVAEILSPALCSFPGFYLAGVAAYNAGPSRVRRALAALTSPTTPAAQLHAVDAVTEHGNYASRVLARYQDFGASLEDSNGVPA